MLWTSSRPQAYFRHFEFSFPINASPHLSTSPYTLHNVVSLFSLQDDGPSITRVSQGLLTDITSVSPEYRWGISKASGRYHISIACVSARYQHSSAHYKLPGNLVCAGSASPPSTAALISSRRCFSASLPSGALFLRLSV